MKVFVDCWRQSLAAVALATVLGPASGDTSRTIAAEGEHDVPRIKVEREGGDRPAAKPEREGERREARKEHAERKPDAREERKPEARGDREGGTDTDHRDAGGDRRRPVLHRLVHRVIHRSYPHGDKLRTCDFHTVDELHTCHSLSL